MISLLSGSRWVLFGCVLLVAGAALSAQAQTQSKETTTESALTSATHKAGIIFMMRSLGLVETLKMMAMEAGAPFKVDDTTTVLQVEAERKELRRTYIRNTQIARFSSDSEKEIFSELCATEIWLPLLRAGATIREIYLNSGNAQIGTVSVSRETCGMH
ncbi:MAG: hypothetical protein VW547_18155 [Alphaproteobacteria bacterium]